MCKPEKLSDMAISHEAAPAFTPKRSSVIDIASGSEGEWLPAPSETSAMDTSGAVLHYHPSDIPSAGDVAGVALLLVISRGASVIETSETVLLGRLC